MNCLKKNETNQKLETGIKKVSQEDFISQLESLVVEESELPDSENKIRRTRVQLTPEKLGKVELEIEMHGKDLVARLVVEQKETKEWVEQQLYHLKKQLLNQEIHVKDFQVLVHQENSNDAMMDQQENPFFKQKQKETEKKRAKKGNIKNQSVEIQNNKQSKSYSSNNRISIFV